MSDTIQIEVIIDKFLHDGVTYTKGDVSTEPKELGEYFCRAGWAKDTSGIFATAEPKRDEVVLLVQDINQSNNSEVL